MRAVLCLLLFAAGCSYPELAKVPGTPTGPPPTLSPLDPLLQETAAQDPEADAVLEERAAELRTRAAELPTDSIEPETRAAMEAAGQR